MKKILLLTLLPICSFSFASDIIDTSTTTIKDDIVDNDTFTTTIKDDIEKRIKYENYSERNPFSLTAHKMNYILPYTYSDNINTSVYSSIPNYNVSNSFKHEEAKFQISLKVPVYHSIFNESDKVYFGITLKSLWQVYASGASRPFRNTDYNPEIFYVTKLPKYQNRDSFLTTGLEHESNGQIQYLSRSWNKFYIKVGTEGDNYAIGLKTWYRLPEKQKAFPFDPSGDDNPDIQDYYGHFELSGIYKYNNFNYSFIGRHNFDTGKGYLELGMTFPLYANVKGYVQFVNGYGETLIDYNHFQRRIGVGVVFSDLL